MASTKQIAPVPFRAGVKTPDPKKFIDECTKSLRGVIANRHIGFTNFQVAGNTEIWMLNGFSSSHAEAKYPYTVLPILTSRSGLYWVAVSIAFEYERGDAYLMGASIILFEGVSTDNKKNQLLRAEWDCSRELQPSPHAQPHWHVLQAQIQQSQASFFDESVLKEFIPAEDEIIESMTENDPQLPMWPRSEKFHFAMASRWHINGLEANGNDLQHEWLRNWLGGCVKYTRTQLAMIYGDATE